MTTNPLTYRHVYTLGNKKIAHKMGDAIRNCPFDFQVLNCNCLGDGLDSAIKYAGVVLPWSGQKIELDLFGDSREEANGNFFRKVRAGNSSSILSAYVSQ